MRVSAIVRTCSCLLILTGAGCEKGRVIFRGSSVRFAYPLPRDTITPDQDRNNDISDGIQIDVRATVRGLKTGDTLQLTSSQNLEGGVPKPTAGTVANNQVVFPSYTLRAGEVTLRIGRPTVDPSTPCNRVDCDEIMISVNESACSFASPREGTRSPATRIPKLPPAIPMAWIRSRSTSRSTALACRAATS